MARRRMIDPKFWGDETVAKLCPEERLFYIGLFSLADDEGRMCGSPSYLRSQIYPYDDISLDKVVTWISHLKDLGLIHLYKDESGDKSQYVDHPKWFKYQRIDYPTSSVLPPCPDFRSHWRKPRTIRRNSKNEYKNDSKNDSSTIGLKEVKKLKEVNKEVKGREGNESNPENPFSSLQKQIQKQTLSEKEKTQTQSFRLDDLKKDLKEKLGHQPIYREILQEIKERREGKHKTTKESEQIYESGQYYCRKCKNAMADEGSSWFCTECQIRIPKRKKT